MGGKGSPSPARSGGGKRRKVGGDDQDGQSGGGGGRYQREARLGKALAAAASAEGGASFVVNPMTCRFFLRGECTRGEDCKFSHDPKTQPCYHHHFGDSSSSGSSSSDSSSTDDTGNTEGQGKGCTHGAERCRHSHETLTDAQRSMWKARFEAVRNAAKGKGNGEGEEGEGGALQVADEKDGVSSAAIEAVHEAEEQDDDDLLSSMLE